MRKFYITTPIYYVNDKPHIGHAYTTVAADAVGRFQLMQGKKVAFVTGTDEHGQKVAKSAATREIEPQTFVDQLSETFRTLWHKLYCQYTHFVRTSSPDHHRYVAGIWNRLVASGDIYLGTYANWYAARDEAFYSENELINGLAPTGAPVEWVEEECYFFRLSKWQQALLNLHSTQPQLVSPEGRRNEVISFIQRGLRDIPVSRTTVKWGIPVPNNSNHTIYVWLDALFSYISAVAQEDYWPCDLHLIGKDILQFHAVYWPAFLMAADLPLPHHIFAHGWWTKDGQKISKSLGNILDPLDLIAEFGPDYLRYFMLREVPFGSDGNYSRDGFVARINAELANNIGNLVQRTVTLVHKYYHGSVPEKNNLLEQDQILLNLCHSNAINFATDMEKLQFSSAIGWIVECGQKANQYIDEAAPWKVTQESRRASILYTLLEAIRCIGIMLQPFTPDGAAKLLSYFYSQDTQPPISPLLPLSFIGKQLSPGQLLPAPLGSIFPRLQK